MKKILISIGLAVAAMLTANAQNPMGNNVTTLSPTTGGTFPLLSAGAKVRYVILSGAQADLVRFYDNSGTNTVGGTNLIVPAYTAITNYQGTNINTYVGTTGVTNFYTNIGTFTTNVSVALSTNALSPTLAFAVSPGTMGAYPVYGLFTRGVNVRCNTNTSIVVYYDLNN